MRLSEGWHLKPSAEVGEGGAELSQVGCDTSGWEPTAVPSTVMGALYRNGRFLDLYMGRNLERVDEEQFRCPWWYRTEFDLAAGADEQCARLLFEGINYRANVWLNGRLVAHADTLAGAFRRFQVGVTDPLRHGRNALAVEVLPPVPGDFTVGFVDWNPTPPDRNMGIWRPVSLLCSGPVSIEGPFVRTTVDTDSLSQAEVRVGLELWNHSQQPVEGRLVAVLDGVEIGVEVSLDAGERRRMVLSPEAFAELNLCPVRLWWPHTMGRPELYELTLTFDMGGRVSDRQTVTFGVREVSDYFTEEGHRGFRINGEKVLIRGGGWVDDLLLDEDPGRLEAQIAYVRHMNLNTVRLEGFWGSSDRLYDLCDRNGILLLAGWSCHWEWENYCGKPHDEFGSIKEPEDMDLVTESWRDQICWLRNHPSLIAWYAGSDALPRPELERRYLDVLEECDATRPYVGAAAMKESKITGSTGMKMNGPYAWVPPIYWYVDDRRGGAFGFNTETGPGAQPPPLSSLRRMIPEEHLWPPDDVWDYHCARGEFGSISRYLAALRERYGTVDDVETFCRRAQIANYEAMRAMLEAFGIRKHRATGVVQWMLNSAWPKIHWQFYDHYLMPTGALYAARKACEPIHIAFDHATRRVCLVNDTRLDLDGLRATVRVVDAGGREAFAEECSAEAPANTSVAIADVPEPPGVQGLRFLDLRLESPDGTVLSENVYWLPERDDVMDFENSEWFFTPVKEYADLAALASLPPARVHVEESWGERDGQGIVEVTLTNAPDAVAFGVELSVVSAGNGAPVLPVFWDDNYLTLFPGQSQRVGARFSAGADAELRVDGWNVVSGEEP